MKGLLHNLSKDLRIIRRLTTYLLRGSLPKGLGSVKGHYV